MKNSLRSSALALAILPLLFSSALAARSPSSTPTSISHDCTFSLPVLTVGGPGAFFDLTDYTIANGTGGAETVVFSFGGSTALTVIVPSGSTATQAFVTPIRLSSPSGAADLLVFCSVAVSSVQVTFSGVFITP